MKHSLRKLEKEGHSNNIILKKHHKINQKRTKTYKKSQ